MPAASSGGRTWPIPGAAASRMPVPGATRPVPNRLFIVKAQDTAIPVRSTTTSPADAGSTPEAAGAWPAKASALACPPGTSAGRKEIVSVPRTSCRGGATRGTEARSSSTVSPPPASSDASATRRAIAPW